MIKVKQLAHVCILAQDLEATRGFDRDVVGMHTRSKFLRDGRTFGLYLDCGGRSHVEVLSWPRPAMANVTRSTTSAWRWKTSTQPSPIFA